MAEHPTDGGDAVERKEHQNFFHGFDIINRWYVRMHLRQTRQKIFAGCVDHFGIRIILGFLCRTDIGNSSISDNDCLVFENPFIVHGNDIYILENNLTVVRG
jgi:hypothetical protein